MLSSKILDSISELLSFVAAPTSSIMLSDLLIAAEGASSTIESDSTRALALLVFTGLRLVGFIMVLVEELAF